MTAPVQEGLHAVVQHGVSYDGDKFDVPFETTLGSAVVNPTEVERSVVRRQRLVRRHVRVERSTSPASTAEGFGLSQPVTSTETAHQDDPNDPATASVKKTFTIAHASRAHVRRRTCRAHDVDLYVAQTTARSIGSSTSAHRRRVA